MATLKKVLAYVLGTIALAFVILVIVRAFHFYNLDKTNAQVEIIHNTKLRIADVMGENLPPDPGAAADATVAGVDANHNVIRDDVELAVFKEYPKSARIRAALLQYALSLQMQFVQPIINEETVIAVAQQRSRGSMCIGELASRDNIEYFIKLTGRYDDFIRNKEINNKLREDAQETFLEKLGSYNNLEGNDCDIDLSTLPN